MPPPDALQHVEYAHDALETLQATGEAFIPDTPLLKLACTTISQLLLSCCGSRTVRSAVSWITA